LVRPLLVYGEPVKVATDGPYARPEWNPFHPRQTLGAFLGWQWRKPSITETEWYVISNPERKTDDPKDSNRKPENPRGHGGSLEERRTAKAYD
jgi:hypothetical protein